MSLSLAELLRGLGRIKDGPDIARITYEVYQQAEDAAEDPWFTSSFHAGMFPYDEKGCGRYAIYSLANIGVDEAIDPYGRSVMDAGKDIERRLVANWHAAGMLLQVSGDDPHKQKLLKDWDHWLTGFPDALLDLRRFGWNHAHPVEVKSKAGEKIREMRNGLLGVDPYHAGQAASYAHMVRLHWDRLGLGDTGLLRPAGSTVHYVSREKPMDSYCFYIPHDEELIGAALERLSLWRDHWLSGTLPQRDSTWRWTERPCDWCEVKKLCKQDDKAGIATLADSYAVVYAKQHNELYDLDAVRKRILERWDDKRREVAA